MNGFYPVQYANLSGYASANYLSLAAQPPFLAATPVPTAVPTPAPTAVPTQVPPPSQMVAGRTAMVVAASGLNMRADSNTYADVIATLAYGVEVTVIGEAINGFYPVRVGTLSGYVSADYLRFGEAAVQSVVTPEPTVVPQMDAYRVVVASENGFLHVQWANYTGYVSREYVTPFGAQ